MNLTPEERRVDPAAERGTALLSVRRRMSQAEWLARLTPEELEGAQEWAMQKALREQQRWPDEIVVTSTATLVRRTLEAGLRRVITIPVAFDVVCRLVASRPNCDACMETHIVLSDVCGITTIPVYRLHGVRRNQRTWAGASLNDYDADKDVVGAIYPDFEE